MPLERRAGQALLVLCLVAYPFVIPRGAQHNVDSRLALTYALVERGTLWVDGYADQSIDRAVREGHIYSDKAPGVSLWLTPLYVLLRLLPLPDAGWPASERFVTRYLLTFLGIGVPHAAFAVWLFHWLRRREAAVWPRLAVVTGYALGTPAYVYTAHAFGHVPAGVCLALGAAALGARKAVLGGALLASAAAFEYPAAVPAVLLSGHGLWRGARWGGSLTRCAAALVGGAAPIAIALALYHTLAFDAPWRTGYAFIDPVGPFATAHATGLAGVGLPQPIVALELLAGARRGLVTVAPWLMLVVPGVTWAWRTHRADVTRAALVFGSLLAINAGYAVWDGGASWGPRHLVAALPFLTPLALPVATRWPVPSWTLVGASAVVTTLATATGSMPPPGATVYGQFLLPTLNAEGIGNLLGTALGLGGAGSLVVLAWAALGCWSWVMGLRRAYGAALAVALALLGAVQLDTRYTEYAEGYYFYLGSRVADGATLYRDAASTQTPGLTLLVAALWGALPGAYAPRLLALGCYALAALLAGRLAERLAGRSAGPIGTIIAALLPLSAGAPHVLDANALLAPFAPGLALAAAAIGRRGRGALTFAFLAVAGIAVKLTFVPLALAALVAAPRRTWQAAGATLLLAALASVALFAWAGPAARDAFTGELESPLLPAGALLATLQFARLEGLTLVLAGAAAWRLRHVAALQPAHAVLIAAAGLPLLALHQGTFVSVARPAEPLLGAYAAAGIVLLGEGVRRGRALVRLALLTGALLLPVSAVWRGSRQTKPLSEDWRGAVLQYSRRGEAVLTPPHLAAYDGRLMLFDYADWTVLGMRAAAGVEPERTYALELIEQLTRGTLPFVISDFRLAYIPGAWPALEAGYERVSTKGTGPLEVSLWLPKRDAAR